MKERRKRNTDFTRIINKKNELEQSGESGEIHIYIISNPAWRGWYKVGRAYNVLNRFESYQTYDPHRLYKLEFYMPVKNPLIHERSIYSNSMCKGEWIKIKLKDLIKLIKFLENKL